MCPSARILHFLFKIKVIKMTLIREEESELVDEEILINIG